VKEKNKSNHLGDEQLALYVDALRLNKVDDLSPEIRAHIDTCPPCHRTALDLYSMLGEVDYSDLDSHPTLQPKEAKVVGMRSIFLRVAAAAALLAVALYFFIRTNTLEDPGTIVKEDQIKEDIQLVEEPIKENNPTKKIEAQNPSEEVIVKETPTKVAPPPKEKPTPKTPEIVEQDNRVMFAANFTPSSEWDDMVGEVVRSNDFEIIAPKLNEAFKPNTKVSFQWKGKSEQRYVVVLNNVGDQTHKVLVLSNEIDLDLHLNPGVYYWKLENDEDLLHVGKFTIE